MCAVSSIGDSPKSNIVILGPEQETSLSKSGNLERRDDDPGNEGPGSQDLSGDKSRGRHSSGGL